MANSSKKIDFKEEKLSVDTIANASKWWEQARDEFVQVGLSQQLSVGPSLEERVRTAQVKVDAIEEKKAKREKIVLTTLFDFFPPWNYIPTKWTCPKSISQTHKLLTKKCMLNSKG